MMKRILLFLGPLLLLLGICGLIYNSWRSFAGSQVHSFPVAADRLSLPPTKAVDEQPPKKAPSSRNRVAAPTPKTRRLIRNRIRQGRIVSRPIITGDRLSANEQSASLTQTTIPLQPSLARTTPVSTPLVAVVVPSLRPATTPTPATPASRETTVSSGPSETPILEPADRKSHNLFVRIVNFLRRLFGEKRPASSHPTPTPTPIPTPMPSPIPTPIQTPTPPPCPTVTVSCPGEADQDAAISADVQGGDPNARMTYSWSLSSGIITAGQGTSTITVNTAGPSGQTIMATLDIGGLPAECGHTSSCSFTVRAPASPSRKFDEYGNIRFDDERARLDNYAVQLQQEPAFQSYMIAYGTCGSEAQARAERAKDYLVNTRGLDPGRITIIDAGCRSQFMMQLYIAPNGAAAPPPDLANEVSPCPACKRGKPRSGRHEDGSEPSPSPRATPTPSPSASTTPSPAPEPPLRVEAKWPTTMKVGDRGTIAVTLVRSNKIRTTITPAKGEATVTETPLPLPIGTPGTTLEHRLGPGYDACALARLSAQDFDFKNEVGECKPLDFPIDPSWEWTITAQHANHQSPITIFVEIQYTNKETKRVEAQVQLWKHDDHIEVGEKIFIIGQINILSTLFAFLGGGVTLVMVYDRAKARRDKKKQEEREGERQRPGFR